jgi:hypothetical protein
MRINRLFSHQNLRSLQFSAASHAANPITLPVEKKLPLRIRCDEGRPKSKMG